MTSLLTARPIAAVLLVFVIATLGSSAKTQKSSLGQVDFPTSGSQKAQAHFLRGVAALHSCELSFDADPVLTLNEVVAAAMKIHPTTDTVQGLFVLLLDHDLARRFEYSIQAV